MAMTRSRQNERSTHRMTNKTARGTKRRCLNEVCARPFYDLNRPEPVCPDCGALFVIIPVVAARKAKPNRSPASFARTPVANVSPAQMPAEGAVLEDGDAKAEAADDAVPDLLLEEDDADDVQTAEVPRSEDHDPS